jgi:HPt (histidine-containing phosphotransfer) domain-containing protein
MAIRDEDPEDPARRPEDRQIDYEIIGELLDLGNSGLLGDLFSTYRLEVGRLFRELDRALEGGDIAAVEKTSHSISGCSASIGASALSAAAKSIEQLAKTGSLLGYEPLMCSALDQRRSTLRVLGDEVRRCAPDARRTGVAVARTIPTSPTATR